MLKVIDIQYAFSRLLQSGTFTQDKSGVKTVEIVGANFIADQETIFGTLNHAYIQKELNWYNSMSLSVHDIEHPIPRIWLNVADSEGHINSNYGWAIYSNDNCNQYENCKLALLADKTTRRACMIYNRPSMQHEYNSRGMSDFMCTYSVQYMIRDDELISIVYMRSNDAVFGYKNDYAWQKHVQMKLLNDLLPTYPNLKAGDIIWNAASLHVYEQHFHLIEEYNEK